MKAILHGLQQYLDCLIAKTVIAAPAVAIRGIFHDRFKISFKSISAANSLIFGQSGVRLSALGCWHKRSWPYSIYFKELSNSQIIFQMNELINYVKGIIV
jgi:hypothetical protein